MPQRWLLVRTLIAICFLVVITQQPSQAQTNQSSCNSSATFSVGSGYTVQNNGYNLNGGTQCINVDTNGTDWNMTTNASVPLNGAPSAYPSIYAGCHWGQCSANQHGMPLRESAITSSPTTWNVTPSTSGNWDISYDIWFNPKSSTSSNSTGLELMVWINHMGSIQPAGSVVASNVSIGGITWNIWRNTSTQNSGTVSYVATSAMNSFSFDLVSIYRDLVNRGFMTSDQFLIDIEAGTEPWTPGSGFATSSFSACVNCSGGQPPAAPTNLSTTASSSSQINLSWTGSSGANTYNVLRSTTNGGPYSQIASGITSTSYSDAGLAASTTYYYVVQAVNGSGTSGNSNQASATTQAGGGGGCGTPVFQIAAGSTAGGGGSIAPYVTDEDFSGGTAVLHTVSVTIPGSVTCPAPMAVYQYERYGTSNFTYTLPGLTAGSSYTVRLHFAETYFTTTGQRRFNVVINGSQVLTNFDIIAAAGAANTAVIEQFNTTANGSGQIVINFNLGSANNPKIDGIEVWGSSSSSPPGAPTNLTATAASSSQINLSWTASSTSGVTYSVFRSTTSGFAPGTGNQIASNVSGTNYSNTGLSASTTYFYLVEAVDSAGSSPASNQASATTQSSGGGGSGNCHTGTSCLKAALPSSQNYSNTSQVANVSSNQTYVASIWIKGSGSVQLYVKNGNWGSTTLAQVQCSASSTYTHCTTPSFSTGSNTQVTFILQDSYAGSGTAYLDDAFMGVSGGSNTLINPGFESGSSNWSISNTSIWAIGQF